MKQVLIKISAVLVTFGLGLGAEMVVRNSVEFFTDDSINDVPQQHQQLTLVLLLQQSQTQPGLGSLLAELQRIDETYKRRCQLPTDWYGDWETVKQLECLSSCNDEWAEARRKAIREELSKYLVRY